MYLNLQSQKHLPVVPALQKFLDKNSAQTSNLLKNLRNGRNSTSVGHMAFKSTMGLPRPGETTAREHTHCLHCSTLEEVSAKVYTVKACRSFCTEYMIHPENHPARSFGVDN